MADNNQQQAQVLGWDATGYVELPDEIPDNLEPGIYSARILTYEKGYYQPKPGAKTPPCPKATVIFQVDCGNGTDRKISQMYCLYTGYPWGAMLKNLFTALGMADANGNVQINFDAISGMDCQVEVTLDEDKNNPDRKYNHIAKVLPPASGADFDRF